MEVTVIKSRRKTIAIQVNSDLSVTVRLRMVSQRNTLRNFLIRMKLDKQTDE